MKHTLQLEIEVDDYAKFPGLTNVWDMIVHEAITGAQEHLSWRFGPAVQVRRPPARPAV